VFKNSLMK